LRELGSSFLIFQQFYSAAAMFRLIYVIRNALSNAVAACTDFLIQGVARVSRTRKSDTSDDTSDDAPDFLVNQLITARGMDGSFVFSIIGLFLCNRSNLWTALWMDCKSMNMLSEVIKFWYHWIIPFSFRTDSLEDLEGLIVDNGLW